MGRSSRPSNQSTAQIGAPEAWAARYDGTGFKVAVLDSGVDGTHPDLKGRIDAAKNFSEAADTVDRMGHGTHVASTVAGSGAHSGGKYKGVVPGCPADQRQGARRRRLRRGVRGHRRRAVGGDR